MAKFLFYDDKLINILLQNEKPSGGAAVQAYGWIRGLHENGHEVYIMTSEPGNESIKKECDNLNFIPLYDKKKGLRWFRWVYYRIPFLFKKIKNTKPDFLYQGVPSWGSFVVAILCKLLNVKYVLRISNDNLLDDRYYINYDKIRRFFLNLGFRFSYCILCQNDYQVGVIHKQFPNKRSVKIANPIIWTTEKQPTTTVDRKYIAWLGLYQYQKNLKLLYEIASQATNDLFCVAGKESSKCDEETRIYLEKLEQLPNVKFVGFLFRDQVLDFLSQAKFLLNTSHYEGFSNTFLEAMYVGTPILTHTNVNPDKIISNYRLGLVYDNAHDLLQQLSEIKPDDYACLSNNVMEYVTQNHDYRILANKLAAYLHTDDFRV